MNASSVVRHLDKLFYMFEKKVWNPHSVEGLTEKRNSGKVGINGAEARECRQTRSIGTNG
jgi:hypothetical protein